jgi:hypothetical protein
VRRCGQHEPVARRSSLIALLLLLLASPTAHAAMEPIDVDVDNPRLLVSPVRFDPVDAAPGDTLQFGLRVQNTSPRQLLVQMRAVPLAGSSNPDELVTATRGNTRRAAAAQWVGFPTARAALRPGTSWTFDVAVKIPGGARPGTYAVAFAASQAIGSASVGDRDTPESEVRLAPAPASTAIVRVSGDVAPDARIRDIEAPRLIWGGHAPRFAVLVENVGDTDLMLDAEVDLEAYLWSAGRTLEASEQFVLPEGRRRLTMRWSDPPLFGSFRPELIVVGGAGSGIRITDELPRVWVLPPWWLIAATAFAVALPLWARRRRRR